MYAVRTLLDKRVPALRIRRISFDVYPHPKHDPGVFNDCHKFLRPFTRQYTHALVFFDRDGSGAEASLSREEIENKVCYRLTKAGWENRAEVVVLDPELEAWVWSDSSNVDRCLGWNNRLPRLQDWLVEKGLWREGSYKPMDPKEAVEAAIHEVRRHRSSTVYSDLARTVSFERCQDPAFLKFKSVLRKWFPIE
jgi:hypothetical protein